MWSGLEDFLRTTDFDPGTCHRARCWTGCWFGNEAFEICNNITHLKCNSNIGQSELNADKHERSVFHRRRY